MPSPPLPREDLDQVLVHTRSLWGEARGQTFFITGGTGFFGLWLLESFADANDTLQLGMRAVVLTRDPVAFAQKAPHLMARDDLVFHTGDLHTFIFPAGRFDVLIHSAADTAVWTKGALLDGLMDSIVTGTRHLLDFAASASVRNFLLVSSGAVYGSQPPELLRVPEAHDGGPDPLLTAAAWAEGKRVAEHMCAVHANRHGYALKIARCFAFVGPHLPLDVRYAIGNFIGDVISGRPIRVSGDGTAVRSYLYTSDLAVWLWTILFRGAPGRAYNVGSPTGVSIGELAREVGVVLGSPHPVEIAMSPRPGRRVDRYLPDVSRATSELQLECRVPLGAAIRKTAEWYGWRDPAKA